MPEQFPLTVQVPIPSYIPRARGVHATGRMGTNVKVRISYDDKVMIYKAAELCGVDPAAFIRWCASYMAEALVEADKRINSHEREANNE